MRRYHDFLIFSLVLTMGLAGVRVHAAGPGNPGAGNFAPGELLVAFRQGVSPETAASVHRRCKISEWRQGYNNSYQIISCAPGKEREMVEAYKGRPEVAYAEPNYYATTCSLPNDEYYPLQWNFPLINLPDAWDISTGEGVVVAVVDTGINPFGRDGFGLDLDDRLMSGYNAIVGTSGGIDYNQHGTHVAGTIGQETNNRNGVAGIAYDARILPVKSLSFMGGGLYSWIINGIRWATDTSGPMPTRHPTPCAMSPAGLDATCPSAIGLICGQPSLVTTCPLRQKSRPPSSSVARRAMLGWTIRATIMCSR